MKQRDVGLLHELSVLAGQDYEFLRYSNDRSVKDAFLAGDIEEPNLLYHDIDPVFIEEQRDVLTAMIDVVTRFDDEIVRRAYLPKLREYEDKYMLLDRARVGDDEGVLACSTRLYGAPQEQYFRYALRGLAARLGAVYDTLGTEPLVQDAYDTLIEHVPEQTAEYPWDHIVLPTPRPYAVADALSAEEIRAAFVEAFMRFGVTNWSALVDAPGERMTFSTNHSLRTIFIPSDEDLLNRKYAMTRERVEALIAHEVGTHVVRRERGEQSELGLLGIGLAGYLRGEEGVATYNEQVLDGTRHFAGGFQYVAVGWASGIDGRARTFRQLYELLQPYMFISSLEHALAYEEPYALQALYEKSKRRAWARCVRIFRGTSGSTPGACFTKDVVYLEGNVAIWELVDEDATWPTRFSLGKYDPANEEHVALLRDMGMF